MHIGKYQNGFACVRELALLSSVLVLHTCETLDEFELSRAALSTGSAKTGEELVPLSMWSGDICVANASNKNTLSERSWIEAAPTANVIKMQ